MSCSTKMATSLGTGVANDRNGVATITPTKDIPAGNVTAKATDPAGNTSDASDAAVATDTTAPAKPEVKTDLTGKAGTKTPVEVSAEPGSTVASTIKTATRLVKPQLMKMVKRLSHQRKIFQKVM